MLQFRDGTSPATVIRRADYTAPAYWVDTVHLSFDLDPAKTRVLNKMTLRRNPDVPAQALKLDGEELNLARVLVNGQGTAFKIEDQQLVLDGLPTEGSFELEIFTTCAPAKNTELMGLYVSNGSFFTQCEAQGFRRITYFLDRPDVMASYTVTLRADRQKYPVLLSNGNLMAQGPLEGVGNEGRHFATWVDPHKKPCYLFALVAGQLVCREQRILSRAGREHLLQVYVRPGDMDKTEHAMNALMASVAWDEAGEQQGSDENKAFHGLILTVRRPSAVVFQTSHRAWRPVTSSGSSAAPALRASVLGADQRLPLSRECMARIRLWRPSYSRQTSVTWRPCTATCGWPAWASRLPKRSGGVCVSPAMRR